MFRQSHLRAGVVSSIVFLIACTFLSYGQRGGGGGGGASAPRGGGGASRGNGPPPGARGANGRGRGQPEQQKDLELDPTNGMELAYVTVVNKDHVSVPGLKKENFKITEDGVDQKLELFSVEEGPLSVGFVLGGPPNESKGVPLEFLKATPFTMNEFFLINDTHSPPGGTVIQSFTTDLMKATAVFPQGGVTADSIFMGLDYLKEAEYKRKFLILVGGTLSGDDVPPGSGLDPFYVERIATKQEVQVYSILTSNDGGDVYDDGGTSYISPLTGGKNYLASPISFSLESTAKEIARGLGVQYEVGYRSTNPTPDGKWRRIRVSVVDAPESAGKISVWTKAGYYIDKEKKKK
jgi:Ca-activated chloride channel family protein